MASSENALATYNTLLSLYPQSPQAEVGKKELADLEEMFAQKNYLAGLYYFRRGGYDSGIIYFKDVLARYPNAPTARLAQLRLVDAYKAIRYHEAAADACAALRKSYPNDADVRRTCDGIANPPAPVASTPGSAPPSSTGPPSPLPVPPTTQGSAPPASPTP